MILYPAIDLKDGCCVRLKQGKMNSAKIYNSNPSKQAKIFQNQGFTWLHIVDLNGACEGKSVNIHAIEKIIKTTKQSIQLGGGIRTLQSIETWINKGISRIILGTSAVFNHSLVYEACKLFPEKISIGIDAYEGKVAVDGWNSILEINVIDLARKFEDIGVSSIIYTDIKRDGVLKGINLESSIDLARKVSIPVIASGGLSSIKDIESIIELNDDVLKGVIIGRALYDGCIDAKTALALVKSKERTINL